jgi:transposase InsO family protein
MGPEFLYLPEAEWPTIPKLVNLVGDDVIEEEIVALSVVVERSLPDVSRFSSWLKLIRTTAWVMRFIRNCRTSRTNRVVTEIQTEEIDAAEKMWWREVQDKCFETDRSKLKSGKQCRDNRLTRLSPTIDKDDIMRVAGRIDYAENVNVEMTKPVILDSGHRFVSLLIQHQHQLAGHQGLETVISRIRERYWIIRCRSAVKKVVANCLFCKKKSAKPAQPMMGQIPPERFFAHEKPFTATGVDYFGPIMVAAGRKSIKRYGVLFTCLTTRAIHLEVANDLSASSCIMAVRRMISRRGQVKHMFSDNGTNLRGADREMRESIERLQDTQYGLAMTNLGIKWSFIPPGAPHMGGCWERMIGSAKRALTAVMVGRTPTDEVLATVFAEVEYIINSRPLTHVSDDNNDPLSLTPNHFLIGAAGVTVAPGIFDERDGVLRRQWRVAQYLVDIYWKRWLKEYLPTLIQRKKWTKTEVNLKPGDLVTVNDKSLPRGMWPVGVIERCFPGQDGVVRVVEVRTTQGLMRRPAVKIHPFDRVDSDVKSTRGGECGHSDSEEEFYGF